VQPKRAAPLVRYWVACIAGHGPYLAGGGAFVGGAGLVMAAADPAQGKGAHWAARQGRADSVVVVVCRGQHLDHSLSGCVAALQRWQAEAALGSLRQLQWLWPSTVAQRGPGKLSLHRLQQQQGVGSQGPCTSSCQAPT
jgi:hypothetical protein